MLRDFSKYDSTGLMRMLGDPKAKEGAFRELYARYGKKIYYFCRRFLGNEEQANDIFQETFLSILNRDHANETIENVQAFLFRIAKNLCLNTRRDQKYNFVPIDKLQLFEETAEPKDRELTQIAVAALDLLPDEHREAMLLQIYNDLSYKDIAEIMEVPVSTVRNWIVRGKKKLAEIIRPYLDRKTAH
ncbi:MAG: RNA polymerase sigma factor [Candidatus Kapaibacterium sp.]